MDEQRVKEEYWKCVLNGQETRGAIHSCVSESVCEMVQRINKRRKHKVRQREKDLPKRNACNDCRRILFSLFLLPGGSFASESKWTEKAEGIGTFVKVGKRSNYRRFSSESLADDTSTTWEKLENLQSKIRTKNPVLPSLGQTPVPAFRFGRFSFRLYPNSFNSRWHKPCLLSPETRNGELRNWAFM